jgi:anti-sigma B factor antagonist
VRRTHVTEALTLSEERTGALRVISVEGELDAITASQLRDRLEASPDGEILVVVDLARATFIDSAALGVLSSAIKRARRSGGDLRLVIAEAKILKIFEITGLTDLFPIFATVEDATADD